MHDSFSTRRKGQVFHLRYGLLFSLDTSAYADIFIGNVSFLCFCTMPAGSSVDYAFQFPAFITVQNKGLVKLRHFSQTGVCYLRKLLVCHGIILLNTGRLSHIIRPIKRTLKNYRPIYGLTP